MSLELLFLGSGTSAGVPMIGCHCAVCSSADPHDQRTRPSALVSYPDESGAVRRLLIDTTPEMRVQMIRQHIDRVDAVIYTHAHADHILGIDDLRRINAVTNTHVDIYADARTLGVLRTMFRYIFEPHSNVNDSFVATLEPHELAAGVPIDFFGARWTPVALTHGRLSILGFRVDYAGHSLAYCTDCSAIPEATYPLLANLDVLVIDALRYNKHPTHMTVDEALLQIKKIQPGRAYLTHVAHDIMHADLQPRLPENVFLAYDGLAVTCGG